MVNIKYLAGLANLAVSEQEAKTFGKQLKDIIALISKLNEVDTKDVELHRSRIDLTSDKYLEDVCSTSLPTRSVLYNAASKHNDYFSVDLILENKQLMPKSPEFSRSLNKKISK
ncbi:MAG: Aspartyl/glutamyl-tRNA(Asn/Gln) amidotransferase subunit C [Candidatus Woesebacteria bacterium GW2011_GWA1_39_21]|uniref:Aspartyl/glutamyl-tRNA(Asn/Gln) amidotransferase subunit C n=1 Tax=Candidatus Woesebacteria bacterium GW2011_GWA1_39_21 TaxID=1618550 RepID=A0A0G0N5M1_9BACT|nr:MAG: Aspartyl/glutamyl-tRNA(Asn/Gln) amidotransferase subunit C [Candidatus Woesebacteria bacterium GW2011_GWA1_39_21]